MNSTRAAAALCVLTVAAGCQQMPAEGRGMSSAIPECGGEPPAAVAETFYRELVVLDPRGLPSTDDVQALGPLLSSGMRESIARARGRQQAEIDARPDDKPSFVEGSLFTSLFEGPTAVLSVTADATSPTRVRIALEHAPASQDATRWTDRALMRCEGGRWRVDDIEFGGDWDFAAQGRLREALDAE